MPEITNAILGPDEGPSLSSAAPSTSTEQLRATRPAERPTGLPLFHISELVGAGREALITHEGQTYHLRITSNRKLILTK
jgi:hemin uptake protein HemP